MKNIFYKSILLTVLLVTSCDSVDFGDVNIDPNNPSKASTAALFTSAQRSMTRILTDTRPNLYVQYITNGQYEDESIYASVNFSYNSFYTGSLNNLNRIIEFNTDTSTSIDAQKNGSNANQIATARLMKAFIFQHITDRWGMVPYSEALQGFENTTPVFDTQEAIYNDLFTEIDAALDSMDSGSGPSGDIIFGGDMEQWAIFANTLKMNMALRLSKKFPGSTELASKKFNEAYASAISSNGENIKFTFLSDENNDSPWEDRFLTRKDYLMADTFVDALIGTGTNVVPEDPRLAKYASVSENTGVFVGAPYGSVNSVTAKYSFITDDIIYNKEAPAYIYTYSQVMFNIAEARELGWISGSAEKAYNSAIEASMLQWGVTPADIATYMGKRPAYSGVADISYQKWVSLFLQGYEGWNDWRRQGTNGVTLTAPSNYQNGGGNIPNRQGYGINEKTQNEDNYNAAVSVQGADNLQTKVWWAN